MPFLGHSNPKQTLWQKKKNKKNKHLMLFFKCTFSSTFSVSQSASYECPSNLQTPLGDCSIHNRHPVTKKTPNSKQTQTCGKHHCSVQRQSPCLLSARQWCTQIWSLSSDSVLLFAWEAETASLCFAPPGEATQAALCKAGS